VKGNRHYLVLSFGVGQAVAVATLARFSLRLVVLAVVEAVEVFGVLVLRVLFDGGAFTGTEAASDYG
jgi:hypothetical protein